MNLVFSRRSFRLVTSDLLLVGLGYAVLAADVVVRATRAGLLALGLVVRDTAQSLGHDLAVVADHLRRLIARAGQRFIAAGRGKAARYDLRLARGFLAGLFVSLIAANLLDVSPAMSLAAFEQSRLAPTIRDSGGRQAEVTPPLPSPFLFRNPLPGAGLSQGFGATPCTCERAESWRGHRYQHFHAGLDFAAALGSPVYAAAAGVVVTAAPNFTGAVIVEIRQVDGSVSQYGHLQRRLPVAVGDKVAVGALIGWVGMTGYTTGPHLHFGLVDANGLVLDPMEALLNERLPGAPDALDAQAVEARFDRLAATIPYADLIRAAARTEHLDPLLLAALIKAESAFRTDAVSRVGALGLTQLMPATAASLGVSHPFDPAENIAGGARYLGALSRKLPTISLVIAGYHHGGANVAANIALNGWEDTQLYVFYVTANWLAYVTAAG